jgi:hypothetical protein
VPRPQGFNHAPGPLGRLALGVGLESHQQGSAHGWRDRANAVSLAASDRQEALVEEIAGHRRVRAQVEPGPHRGIERRETEQGNRRSAGKGYGPERGRRHDAERSFRADQEFR